MKKGSFKKFLALLLTFTMLFTLAGCKKEDETTDNEVKQETEENAQATVTESADDTDVPLVVGYDTFSQKFSPFFATTAMDVDVEENTQILLLTSDRSGAIVYKSIEGEKREYNGTEYTYKGISDIDVNIDDASNTTTYTIKIRDDIVFSDGVPMTIDDVIFSLYVRADASYDGSSTLYSQPIIGMKNYRANNSLAETVTASEVEEELANPSDALKERIKEEAVRPLLEEEYTWVESLYGNESYKSYTDEYPVAKDLFVYFYHTDDSYDSTKVDSVDQVITDIVEQYGSDYKRLAADYGDESYLDETVNGFASDLIYEKLKAEGANEVPNIEGIKKIDNYTLEIKTEGFDATTIYQFGFEVAPLHYYGDETLYDYDNNQFGFTRGDLSIVKDKTATPLGAGPYKFVKYDNKTVYFEANELYYKGCPKTKYLQFKETAGADKISGVGTGTIDLTDPTGSVARFAEISGYNSNNELSGDVITTSTVDNLGYGYIGINAYTVNVGGELDSDASKDLRKAFATILSVYRDVAIDSYYGESASVINYPISNTSWAAPKKTDAGYEVCYSTDVDGNPIYTSDMSADDKYAAAINAAIGYLKAAGFTFDEASGKFTAAPSGAKLDYEIIIPGDGEGDHPSFAILTASRTALESIGITLTINDPSDSNKLWESLDANTAELWVAAWGATVDPDMYQVYHSSNATGSGTNSNHYYIQDAELDDFIIKARQSADQEYRKSAYKNCLDIILDWAVEIPVYQRQNCIIMSTERINIDTMTPDITTYWGWSEDIENIEMVK